MSSNFKFLEKEFPLLYQIGTLAEQYLYSDPNTCIIKLGMFGETIVNYMFQLDDIPYPSDDNTHANRINLLRQYDLLPFDIDDALFLLRIHRNRAVHDNYKDKAESLLKTTFTLSVWFYQAYHNPKFTTPEFSFSNISTLQDTIDSQEQLITELKLQLEQVQTSSQLPTENITNRINITQLLRPQVEISESMVRDIVDEQLQQFGWSIVSYTKDLDIKYTDTFAVAEFPTKNGRADYALFVKGKLYGIVEIKKQSKNVSAMIQNQCKEYSATIRDKDLHYLLGRWGEYQVPFVFASNGKKYNRQIDDTGVWFRDNRKNSNIPKPLRAWSSPEGLVKLFEKDIDTANQVLQNASYATMLDKSGLGLRYYQVDAIKAIEEAIINGKDKILLAMATGTGKTRTILGMIYRFLNSNRFKNILFLVDRNSLGEQTDNVFKDVKLEQQMSLNQIYTVKALKENKIDENSRVHIATVQSMVKNLSNDSAEYKPSAFDYDLIIIDEAHRGYTLDKQMSEDELFYRDDEDFISKYRYVIDYFDAVQIALTATPAKHTSEIFGEPIYFYSYRKAVVDGYLSDYDAPIRFQTKLNTEGIQYKKNDILVVIDPITGEVQTSQVDDEMNFDVDSFNKRIKNSHFNETVLKELTNHIDPFNDKGKTLIFAVDNNHADEIVHVLQKIYESQGLDGDAILKITGSIGDSKIVSDKIRAFKTEKYPNIVVTVDLLTTGIDVPEITNIVFMRCVKSRILFEQMIGRATRKCDKIGKTHFNIYDAVRIFDFMEDISNMKPVVTNVKTTFATLIDSMTETDNSFYIDQIKAKLSRSIVNLAPNKAEIIENITQKSIKQIVEELRPLSSNEARKYIVEHRQVFNILDIKVRGNANPTIYSEHQDELIGVEKGYGAGDVKQQDYIEGFIHYITENQDTIEALKLVCTKPSSLTKQQLRELLYALDKEGYSETQVSTAYNEKTNQEITLDIISIIRAQLLGTKLVDKKEKVSRIINQLIIKHQFNVQQKNILTNIRDYLFKNTVIVNKEIFEETYIKDNVGTYDRVNIVFENKFDDILEEINYYLYEGDID